MKILEILTEAKAPDYNKLIDRMKSAYVLMNNPSAPEGEKQAAKNGYDRIMATIERVFGKDQATRADQLISNPKPEPKTTYSNTSGGDFFDFIRRENERMDRERELEKTAPYGRQGDHETWAEYIKRIVPRIGEEVDIQFQLPDETGVPPEWVIATLDAIVGDYEVILSHNGVKCFYLVDCDMFGRDKKTKRLYAICLHAEHDSEIVFQNADEERFWNSYFGDEVTMLPT